MSDTRKRPTSPLHPYVGRFEVHDVIPEHGVPREQILDELGCSYSKKQSGLFVWAKAPASIASVEQWIDEILYGTKVFITPGFIFGEAGNRHVRISLCAPVEKLREAHARLVAFRQTKKQPVTARA